MLLHLALHDGPCRRLIVDAEEVEADLGAVFPENLGAGGGQSRYVEAVPHLWEEGREGCLQRTGRRRRAGKDGHAFRLNVLVCDQALDAAQEDGGFS